MVAFRISQEHEGIQFNCWRASTFPLIASNIDWPCAKESCAVNMLRVELEDGTLRLAGLLLRTDYPRFTTHVSVQSSSLGQGHRFECRVVFERAVRSSSFGSNGTSFVHIEASTQRSAIRAFEKYLWLRGTMVLCSERAMITLKRSFLWFYYHSESIALVSTMASAWARCHVFLFQCFSSSRLLYTRSVGFFLWMPATLPSFLPIPS